MPRISLLAPSLNLQGDTGHRFMETPGQARRAGGRGKSLLSLSWALSRQEQAERCVGMVSTAFWVGAWGGMTVGQGLPAFEDHPPALLPPALPAPPDWPSPVGPPRSSALTGSTWCLRDNPSDCRHQARACPSQEASPGCSPQAGAQPWSGPILSLGHSWIMVGVGVGGKGTASLATMLLRTVPGPRSGGG